jgi:hypothetical protein
MWGNTLGWIISIVLLAGMILGLRAIDSLQQISSPTEFGTSAKTLAKIQLPVRADTVVPMTDPRDAGPIYREAINDYLTHRDEYDNREPGETKSPRGVELLVSATTCSGMNLFAEHPEELLSPDSDKAGLKALEKLATRTLAMNLRQKDPSDAMRYADAVFALGAKLFNERVTVGELQMGLGLMRGGARAIRTNATKMKDMARIGAVDEFLRALQIYDNETLTPTLSVLQSVDPNIVGQHPGDLFYVARHADERLWRVAAINGLGRLRFFAGEGGMLGDQRGAVKALGELSKDKDPIVATAAKSAASMTLEQYQGQE